jgi:hypothetical protein
MPIDEVCRFNWGELDVELRATRQHPRHGPGSERPGRRMSVTAPADCYEVQLDTALFHADPVHAVLRVRELLATPATLSGIACTSVQLVAANLSFVAGDHGRVRLSLKLAAAIPFPYAPWPARPEDAVTFDKALHKAQNELEPVSVMAAFIEENERWWWFGAQEIGTLGAAVRKRDGYAASFGSGRQGTLEALLWAFDVGLADPDACLRITRITDEAVVSSALSKCFGLDAQSVHERTRKLPVTFDLDRTQFGMLWPAREAMEFEVVFRND